MFIIKKKLWVYNYFGKINFSIKIIKILKNFIWKCSKVIEISKNCIVINFRGNQIFSKKFLKINLLIIFLNKYQNLRKIKILTILL